MDGKKPDAVDAEICEIGKRQALARIHARAPEGDLSNAAIVGAAPQGLLKALAGMRLARSVQIPNGETYMDEARRDALKSIATLAGIAACACAARAARAQAKATKQAMQYQDQPKNGQQCDACTQYIPGPKPDAPGGCKVVDGEISPKGWCIAFVKKS